MKEWAAMRKTFSAISLLLAIGTPGYAEEPKPIWSYRPKENNLEITWVGFSPGGALLCAREEPRGLEPQLGRLRIWDAASKKELKPLLIGRRRLAEVGPNLAFADKDEALCFSGPPFAIACKALTGEKKSRKVFSMQSECLGIWPRQDGKGFFVADTAHKSEDLSDARLTWFTLSEKPAAAEQKQTRLEPFSSSSEINRLAVNSQGTLLAAAFSDTEKILTLKGIELGNELKLKSVAEARRAHLGRIHSLLFSPDGKTLASGSSDGAIRLWDVVKPPAKGWLPTTSIPASQFTIIALAFRPDGRYLAFGNTDSTIGRCAGLVNVKTGKIICSIPAAPGVEAMAFSPDGRLLATGNFRGIVELWDVNRIINGIEE